MADNDLFLEIST